MQYWDTLTLLSKSIDEVRGVYKNLKETDNYIGLYPFEGLKDIYEVISKLGYGKLDSLKATEARKHINYNWKELRQSFLSEFDRSEPSVHNSPYV